MCATLVPAVWHNSRTAPRDPRLIPVRFAEGATHGFLVLKDDRGAILAHGDLLQTARGSEVESRTVFHFADGSFYDEIVTFTQDHVFRLRRYQVRMTGPAFEHDEAAQLDHSGSYRVTTRAHRDKQPHVLEGTLDLPADVYDGMATLIAKNLDAHAIDTVHYVAFTPTPRVVELEFKAVGTERVSLGATSQPAVHYVLTPRLGGLVRVFAKLLGRTPPAEHMWIDVEQVPVFVAFQGPLYSAGPVWRIELSSPRSAAAAGRSTERPPSGMDR